jgi:hypothetical protein
MYWLDVAKIYIELVSAEKAIGTRTCIADNPNLIKLKTIYLKNNALVKSRSEEFIKCIIVIW